MGSSRLNVMVRDIRQNAWAWSAAGIVSATVSVFIAWCLNFVFAVGTAPDSFFVTIDGSRAEYTTLGVNMMVFTGVPAAIILAIVLSRVTTHTAISQSLWRLGGASPRQIIAMILMQTILVSCAGTIGGVAISLPFQAAINNFLVGIGTGSAAPLAPVYSPLALGGSIVILAVIATVAGVAPAARTARHSPIVLRAEPELATRPGIAYLITVLAVFMMFVLPLFASLGGVTLVDDVALALVVTLPLGQAMVLMTALAAPWLLPLVIRAWTWPFAVASWTSWRVARHLAIARIAGSAGTVAPLTLGIGLFGAFGMISATAENASPMGASLKTFEGIVLLLPVGVISAVGSIAVVIMAARQHTEDIVTLRSATATRGNTDRVMLFEAVIITVSALLIAIIPMSIQYALLAFALGAHQRSTSAIGFSLGPTAVLVFVAFVGMATALLCAARSAWRRPLVELLADR